MSTESADLAGLSYTPARRRLGTRAPRLGLRARITLAFALSAALLSALLAGTTWALTRQNLVTQRESSATRVRPTSTPRIIQPKLTAGSDSTALFEALSGLEAPTGRIRCCE